MFLHVCLTEKEKNAKILRFILTEKGNWSILDKN